MLQYICVGVGCFLALLFIIQLGRGKKYAPIVENLDSNTFPLSDLYVVGFAWSAKGLFRLKGKNLSKLQMQAALLYEPQYAEYYANVAWAQVISLVHLFLAVTFLLASVMYEYVAFILGVGVFMCVLLVTYGMENMKNIISKRTEECEAQLPEVVSTMAILVNSGMVLREAWNLIANNNEGAFYELMRKAADDMKNGYSDADAIFLFGKATNSSEIKKFTSALLQSMEKGGAELSSFLARESSELWSTRRQRMLQAGEKAATKLLLPIVLIFVGIIIIVLTAAFAGSLF